MKLPAPLVAILLATTLFLPAPANAQNADAAGDNDPPRKIDFTPNPRYTVFDGPLREDGTIDYIAALNGHFSAGVTHEDNAYRALFLLMSRDFDPDAPFDRQADFRTICEMLEITDEELAASPTIKGWHDFADERGLGWEIAGDIESLTYDSDYTHEQNHHFVAWLASIDQGLNQLVKAIDRPAYWAPVTARTHEHLPGTVQALYGLGEMRHFARALQHRLKWSLHLREADKAVTDLIAIYRLAQLVSRGVTLIDSLVAISIDALVIDTLYPVLRSGQLNAAQLERLATAWGGRERLVPLHETMRLGELAAMMSMFQVMATGQVSSRPSFSYMEDFDATDMDDAIRRIGIDLNRGTERLGRYVIQQSALLRAPTLTSYRRVSDMREESLLSELENLTEQYIHEDEDGEESVRLNAARMDRAELTDLFVDLIYGRMAEALDSTGRTYFSLEARRQVALAAIALERYRLAHSRYPDSLEVLTPDYLPAIPVDPIDGQPLRYRVDADGAAVVYSIFADLKDDGGTTDIDDWTMQDGDYVWRLTPPPAE